MKVGVSRAQIYNVGTSTINDIKEKGVQLEQFTSKLDSEEGIPKKKNCMSSKQQSFRRWRFTHRSSLGEPISDL